MTLWLIVAACMILGIVAYMARGVIGLGASPDVAIRQSIRDMVAAQHDENVAGNRRAFT